MTEDWQVGTPSDSMGIKVCHSITKLLGKDEMSTLRLRSKGSSHTAMIMAGRKAEMIASQRGANKLFIHEEYYTCIDKTHRSLLLQDDLFDCRKVLELASKAIWKVECQIQQDVKAVYGKYLQYYGKAPPNINIHIRQGTTLEPVTKIDANSDEVGFYVSAIIGICAHDHGSGGSLPPEQVIPITKLEEAISIPEDLPERLAWDSSLFALVNRLLDDRRINVHH
jgi:hypothetical protein